MVMSRLTFVAIVLLTIVLVTFQYSAVFAATSDVVSTKSFALHGDVKDLQWLTHSRKTLLLLTTKGSVYHSSNDGVDWR